MREQGTAKGVSLYRYGRSVTGMPIIGGVMSFATATLGFVIAARARIYELDAASIVFVIGGVILFVVRPIQLAEIVIAADGIGARRFGHLWKFVRWHDVRKVLNVKYEDPSSRRTINSIFVDDSDKDRSWFARKITSNQKHGSLSFDSRIAGYEELLKLIESKCDKSAVKFVFLDRTVRPGR